MKLKEKSWIWKLTFPFAHNNYTAIGETIYYPKGHYPTNLTIEHEKIHLEQQKQVGLVKFLFLYIFALPFLYNPYRFKWEYDAYVRGSKLSHDETMKILKSYRYGWLCH